jgi:cullin-associated NEDD8-dissociated protein 1
VIAIKYTIVERPQPIDAYIKPCIASFLLLIKDEDRVSSLVPLLDVCN